MLEKIRALAMEKLASEEEVDAFMEGFEQTMLSKEANFGSGFKNILMQTGSPDGGSLMAKAVVGLGASLLGAAIVKGISSGSNAIGDRMLRNKFDMALAQVMSSNKIVKGARPERARDYAETIFRFAPHVAADPNLLGSILSNAVLGESIDPQTIKTLVELEGRYVESKRTQPLAGIRM